MALEKRGYEVNNKTLVIVVKLKETKVGKRLRNQRNIGEANGKKLAKSTETITAKALLRLYCDTSVARARSRLSK